MSQKRSAELRARQVLLMCDQMDDCRRRLDVDSSPGPMPIDFPPGAVVLCDKDKASDTSAERDQPPPMASSVNVISSSTPRDGATPTSLSLRTPTRASSDGSMSVDDYRRALRTMQENSALKTEKLQNELTSLKLELANATLELEQTKHALRKSERENERIRSAMDFAVAGSEKTTIQLSEENAEMMKKMQELRAERDALVLENTMLKKGAGASGNIPSSSRCSETSTSPSERISVHSCGGLSARLQRVKLMPQRSQSSGEREIKGEEGEAETAPMIGKASSSSLSFRAKSLCE